MASMEFGMRLIDNELEEFKKIIMAIKDMVNDKKANIIFGVNEDIRVEIDDSSLTKYSLEKKELKVVVNREFIPIILALLEGKEDEFVEIQVRTYQSENEKANKEEINNFSNLVNDKMDFVNKVFMDVKIKNRYIIKSTTKHSIISSIEWEINNKLYDGNEECSMSSTYATLKINTDKRTNEVNPLFKLLPFMQLEKNDEHFLIDCDENDIEFIIKVMNDIKNKLNKFE